MTTINSNRITGLATGMDIDEMVNNMLVNEQNKIDKAEQKKTTQEWQQETYREVISDVKGLYDKYFSISSSDCILSSKAFNTVSISSSNSNAISATASAGASNINYKIKVEAVAEGAKIQSTGTVSGKSMEMNSLAGGNATVKINGEEIDLSKATTLEEAMKTINDSFGDGSVKISYSEMMGKVTIETTETGIGQSLTIEGAFFEELGMDVGKTVTGSNAIIKVKDASGNEVTIERETNSFTIDNITYNVKNKTDDYVSITSTSDTSGTVEKVKAFLDDYNSMMDNIYELVTQKKNSDYPPLTEAQKEEMTEKEIENWEAKAKAGILRNDSEMRSFMDSIKSAVMGEIGGLGFSLSDIGIEAHSDYNKPGQLVLNEEKFISALEENGEQVYEVFTTAFENVKKVTYDYAGSSSSVFAKKAGIDKTATAINNLFSEQIRNQETHIKDLISKMQEKQEKLYLKFANLESSMNSLNSQMNYLISSLS